MNVLRALLNISKWDSYDLSDNQEDSSKNRVSAQGMSLERFVKDSFCGIPGSITASERETRYDKVFLCKGSRNRIPDAIIRKGDSIEIKKMEKIGRIHFNSSPPKSKLHFNDERVDGKCKKDEQWTVKDIVYVVGILPPGKYLEHLFFVYGDCYAAENSLYENAFERIKSKISEMSQVSTEGNEFGLMRDVDYLLHANLRIRPLWSVESPWDVFKEILPNYEKKKFTLFSVMLKEKYSKFHNDEILAIEKSGFSINDVKIRDPNDPSRNMGAKLLAYMR